MEQLISHSQQHHAHIILQSKELIEALRSQMSGDCHIPGNPSLDLGCIQIKANGREMTLAPKYSEYEMEGDIVRVDIRFFGTKEETEYMDGEYEHSLEILDLFAEDISATIFIGGNEKPIPVTFLSGIVSLQIGHASLQLSLVEE